MKTQKDFPIGTKVVWFVGGKNDVLIIGDVVRHYSNQEVGVERTSEFGRIVFQAPVGELGYW